MRTPILCAGLAVVGLASASAAQSSFTSPAGYEAKSGAYWTYSSWAYHLHGREQHADPTVTKSKATLTRLQYRTQDYTSYAVGRGMGRTYKNAKLMLGHCDTTKLTATFSMNYKGTPTTVYNGKFSLPSFTSGKPAQKWGNVCDVAFASPFTFNGRDDLLMDWTFEDGKLANGSTAAVASYAIDGFNLRGWNQLAPNSSSAPGSVYLPRAPFSSSIRCADSSHGTVRDAYAYLNGYVYADNYPVANYAGKVRVSSSASYYLAKSANTIAVVTVGGSDKGLTVPGAKCFKLHANMGFILAMTTRKSSGGGTTSGYLPNTPITYDNSWAGGAVVMQAAWEDSSTKQLGLSIASKIVLTKKPLYHRGGRRVYEYRWTDGKTYGPYRSGESQWHNPIERFTAK